MAEVMDVARASLKSVLDEVESLGSDTSIAHVEVHPLVGYLDSKQPRAVPARALVGAIAAWFGLVYALCYVALPATASMLGLYSNLIPNLVVNTLTLIPAAGITMGLAALVQPEIVTHLRAKRDPVIAATLGSFLVWLGLVETVSAIQPLTAMPWYEAITFFGLNVVESSMFGMMLASFVRTPGRAFALGAAFQLLLVGLFTGIVG